MTIRFNFLYLWLIFSLTPLSTVAQVQDENSARAIASYIDGLTHFENGETELALDKLTAAYLIHSKDAGITYALSEVYLATGDLTNAAYYGQMSTRMKPENKWYHLNMAEIYSRSGRNEMAVKSLRSALEYHPGDTDILYLLAQTYIDFGELKQSNDVLDEILDLRGSTFEIHLRKFQNYNALQQTENALRELEQMRSLRPGNITTLHTISQYYLELNQTEEARDVLLDAFERHPGNERTLLLLADIFVKEKSWDDLGTYFLKMIDDPLISPAKKMELIDFLVVQKQANPGVSQLNEQVAIAVSTLQETEREYIPAQLFAAEYYLNEGEEEMALETLETVTELNPENGQAWSQRLQLMFSRGEYEEVIALSERASESAPDNAFIQFFTGASYMLTDRYEEAEEWLQSATMAPSRRNFRSIIHGTLGDVQNELDDWESAESSYTMALRLDRDNHTALNNYAYYLSLRGEKLEEALDYARRAVSIQPENPSYLDTAGWVYFKLGNIARAKEFIQRSIDAGAESADVFEHFGDVLEAEGNFAEAVTWWQKALETDPDRDYLQQKIEQAENE